MLRANLARRMIGSSGVNTDLGSKARHRLREPSRIERRTN